MADKPLLRCFWLVLDRLDYWLVQARLRLADMLSSPLSCVLGAYDREY
ncbi:MAG: hypothetical protein JOY83_12535 [Alphaproteobacteria bacterium]|nr:hypothetical protein [Alphaproteobacteria bacterium]